MKILKYTFHVIFFLYIALVIFASLYSFKGSGIDLSDYIFGIRADRIVHFIMFIPYSVCAWLAFGLSFKRVAGKNPVFILFLTGIIISSITEILQTFSPNRDFDIYDLSANYLGIISGSLFVFIMNKCSRNVWPGRLQ